MVCGSGQWKPTTTKTKCSCSILKVVRGGDQRKPTPKNEHLCSFLEVVNMWWQGICVVFVASGGDSGVFFCCRTVSTNII